LTELKRHQAAERDERFVHPVSGEYRVAEDFATAPLKILVVVVLCLCTGNPSFPAISFISIRINAKLPNRTLNSP
jgi:hypothetical protein